MGINRIDALVLWAADAEVTAAFYRALGLPLTPERHGDGPAHHACELDGVHIAVYETTGAPGLGATPGHRETGATLLGFQVDSVEDAVGAVRALGAPVVRSIEDVPWGRRAVVADPDGRPVELNQAR